MLTIWSKCAFRFAEVSDENKIRMYSKYEGIDAAWANEQDLTGVQKPCFAVGAAVMSFYFECRNFQTLMIYIFINFNNRLLPPSSLEIE